MHLYFYISIINNELIIKLSSAFINQNSKFTKITLEWVLLCNNESDNCVKFWPKCSQKYAGLAKPAYESDNINLPLMEENELYFSLINTLKLILFRKYNLRVEICYFIRIYHSINIIKEQTVFIQENIVITSLFQNENEFIWIRRSSCPMLISVWAWLGFGP